MRDGLQDVSGHNDEIQKVSRTHKKMESAHELSLSPPLDTLDQDQYNYDVDVAISQGKYIDETIPKEGVIYKNSSRSIKDGKEDAHIGSDMNRGSRKSRSRKESLSRKNN